MLIHDMKTSIARRARAALFVVLALEGLYFIPTGIYLNTPLSSRLFNRHPERFHIRWRLALSPWPGLVSLSGVETGGRSHVIDWHAHIGSVTATFRILPLFHRAVHLDRVRARGVDYLQRPRPAPGETPDPGAVDWPPEALLAIPDDSAAGIPAPKPAPGPPWTVRADRIRCDVKQIWIGRYRVTGPARVDASMILVARGPLEFPRLDYTLDSGDLFAGKDKLFENFRLGANFRLASFTPKGRKAGEVIHGLSGDVVLDTRRASFGFLDFYFRKSPDLKFSRQGPARMHLKLEAGRLLPGTSLELEGDQIEAVFMDQRLTGSGHVMANVEAGEGTPRSRLEAVLDDFQISRLGRTDSYAHGKDFRIVATSTSLDLADPFDNLHVAIDLPEAQIPDLSVYNVYFPPDSRFSILSGAGRLSYHFVADSDQPSLQGKMDLVMSGVAARFEDVALKGDVRIFAPLRAGNPLDLGFDISGTRIEIHSADPPWTGSIRLPVSKMSFTEPMQVTGRTRLSLQDTSPIVAVFDAYHDMPHILERLMTIHDVRGTADFRVGKDAVDVRDLDIGGEGFHALADLTFGSHGRDGILYLRLHGFSLGVDLRESKKKLQLLLPRRWFDAARAERRGAAIQKPGD
jgi:hypothetical protein